MAVSLTTVGAMWLLTFLFFAAFEVIYPHMNADPLDKLFLRSASSTLDHIGLYTNEARQYFFYHVLIDTIFPPVYGFCNYASLDYLLAGAVPRWLVCGITLGCVADMVENACFLWMLHSYPWRSEFAASLSCPTTRIKFIGLGLGLGGIIACLSRVAYGKVASDATTNARAKRS